MKIAIRHTVEEVFDVDDATAKELLFWSRHQNDLNRRHVAQWLADWFYTNETGTTTIDKHVARKVTND